MIELLLAHGADPHAAGTLSGEDVIPGFSCPVAELFV